MIYKITEQFAVYIDTNAVVVLFVYPVQIKNGQKSIMSIS